MYKLKAIEEHGVFGVEITRDSNNPTYKHKYLTYKTFATKFKLNRWMYMPITKKALEHGLDPIETHTHVERVARRIHVPMTKAAYIVDILADPDGDAVIHFMATQPL